MRLISSLLGRYKPNPPLKSEIPKWSKVYANLPESYILRRSRKLIKKSPAAAGSASATFLELTPRPVSAMMRPWSAEFEMEHDFRKKSRGVCVQPIKEDDWMWFKGDRVGLCTSISIYYISVSLPNKYGFVCGEL